jgi:hypothetical protein
MVLAAAVVAAGATQGGTQTMSGGDARSAAVVEQTPDAAAAVPDEAAVEAVASRWQSEASDGGAEMRRALRSLSAEQLALAAAADSAAAFNSAVTRRAILPASLGELNTDLVFVPLTPCRIIDTRFAVGMIAANTSRDFDANPGSFTAQGGSNTDCGLPGSDVGALAVTIVAVNPQGAGNLRAYPAGVAAPNAAVINYALPGSGLNVANTTILPLTQDILNTNEFTIRADVSATHVVADVVGYFWAPEATALECQTLENSVVVANNAQINFPPGLISPACPAGYTLTGGGNRYSGNVSGFWWWNSHPVGATWVTAGRNESGANVTVFVQARCCRVPGL